LHSLVERLILRCSLDIDPEGGTYGTSLHAALAKGSYFDIALLLLESGADIYIQEGRGETPLDAASRNGERDFTWVSPWSR
jgi:Ankyrin repeats (many copies)